MKKHSLFLLPLCFSLLVGCNNSHNKEDDDTPIIPVKTLSEIEISHEPTKTVYETGDELDLTGLVINAIYSDETKEEITNYSISNVDMSTAGTKTVTVTYEGRTATFVITVNNKISQLDAPVLTLNNDKNGLMWTSVEGALNYSVKINDDDPYVTNETNLLFGKEEGEFTAQITAKSGNNNLDSEPAIFSWVGTTSSIQEIEEIEGGLSLKGVVGSEIEYKLDNGQYVKLNGTTLSVNQNGLYTFHVKSGTYEIDDSYIYYFDGLNSTKSILLSSPTVQSQILEDGSEETNADLQEKYRAYKYDGSWKDSIASLVLDTSNKGFTDDKCVKIEFWKHSANFKFERTGMTFGTYNTLSVTVKGTGDVTEKFRIQFMINEDAYLGNLNIKGIYATYALSELGTNWTRYTINLDDPNWTITLGSATFNPTQAINYLSSQGISINSFGELLPYFDTYSFLTYCTADTNYSHSYLWFDDAILSNTEFETGKEELFALQDNYAFASDSLGGKLNKGDDGTYSLSFDYEGNVVTLPVLTNTVDGKLRITCTVTNYDFDAFLIPGSSGASFTLDSVTGTATPLLNNLRMEAYQIVDDFESYLETGTGYDANHTDPTARSGLRSAYYSEYYNGGSGSPLGGNGWALMGSTDYLNLNVDSVNVHSGNKSARFKYNSSADCRYHSYGLFDGTAEALPSSTTFSFWTKGVGTRTNIITVKVYSINQVNPSNQSVESNFVKVEFSIPSDSDWVECKITLKSTTSYYGFSIMPNKYNGDGAYFYIDDVTVYNDISPWGI